MKPERGAVWGRVYPLSGSISWRAAVLLPAAHLPIKPPAVARRQRRRRQAQSGMQFAKPFPPPSRNNFETLAHLIDRIDFWRSTACRPCAAPCRNCALTSRMVGQVVGVEMDRARRAVDQRQFDLAMPVGHPQKYGNRLAHRKVSQPVSQLAAASITHGTACASPGELL